MPIISVKPSIIQAVFSLIAAASCTTNDILTSTTRTQAAVDVVSDADTNSATTDVVAVGAGFTVSIQMTGKTTTITKPEPEPTWTPCGHLLLSLDLISAAFLRHVRMPSLQ